ncbi:unnamed protein product [Bathycoccus prasinos]
MGANTTNKTTTSANENNNKYKSPTAPPAFNTSAPGRERFYNSIKFDSSGDLQRASEIDERMIREKYDQDSELVDLEREILTGEDEEKKDAALGSLAVRGGGAQPPSRLGNAAVGKMVTRTEQREAKEMTGNNNNNNTINENKNNKKDKEMMMEERNKESSGGKGGSNDATAAAATEKQDSGSNDDSNKLSESNESKLLRSQQQRGVKNPSGSGGSGDGSDDNNTKNKINNLKTSGDEKMMIIKENGTNENAAEMNENDLLCDFGAEKQPMVVASPRKKSKTAYSSDLNRNCDGDTGGRYSELEDGRRQEGRNNKQKQEGDKNAKLVSNNNSKVNNNNNNSSNDNSNSSGRQGGRKQRNPVRAPKRNDSSSGDDLIIPDEEETKNANLLSECDNLFVPPVAPLFKPPNHAGASNAAMHKSASGNIDVNDGTNAKTFGANGKAMNTINTIDDSLYDQQFQIEPELLSARPGSDDSFRLFDPAATQGKSNEGSDEGEQLASGRGRRRRSSGRNTNNKSNSTRKTSGSDNSSYDEEADGSREKLDNNAEESDSDIDISNDLSDEEVYEADYEDKERLIDDLEDDLGENTNNHRVGRPLIIGSMGRGSVGGEIMPGMLVNGRRAQRGRPPKHEKVAPSRAISGKKTNLKGASNTKGSTKSNNKSSSSLATLTTMRPASNKSIRGDSKSKMKATGKMFDDLGEYTIAKVDEKKRSKQAGGSKSTANTNNKMVGKRNLSSAMARSGSENAPNKRGRKNVDSDTKSLSSSGLSEGFQTSALGHAIGGTNTKSTGTTAARGREPNPQGGPRRSKHHNPWGLDEAQALIEGVSRCGGGKWADIKKLGFPEIEHRTAVDLKDKWRNLLRIATLPTPSGRETAGKSGGDKKREIPRAMLDRVRELAMLHAKNKERELAAKAAQAQQRS